MAGQLHSYLTGLQNKLIPKMMKTAIIKVNRTCNLRGRYEANMKLLTLA
jgi:hypothetical protein